MPGDWRIIPVRRETRGAFPDHGDEPPRPVLTLADARARARERLQAWRRDHG